MTYFTEAVDFQETETLEVNSEGEKLRRESEEQNVDLSDQYLTAKKEARNTERAVINASKIQTSLSFIKKDIDKIAQEE